MIEAMLYKISYFSQKVKKLRYDVRNVFNVFRDMIDDSKENYKFSFVDWFIYLDFICTDYVLIYIE